MDAPRYLHGYDPIEQERLLTQARYWRELICTDLPYRAGDRLLEIGCGVGAVLGLLHDHCPALHLSGVDIEPAQIAAARQHLDARGLTTVELEVADAARLPWPDASFDHVFLIWVIEHLVDPLAILQEARRVLRPGGTITITETDYASISVYPPSADYDYFLGRFIAHFNRHGDAFAGRKLGALLEQVGFTRVENRMIGLHRWNPQHRQALAAHIDYLLEFIEPLLPELLAEPDCDRQRLEAGLAWFRTLREQPLGSISHLFFRASGTRPD